MYAWETYYYFQSHSGTSGLFLNCEGNGEIGDNQNVSIYKSTGSGENKDHLFKLARAYTVDDRTVAGCTIRSKLDPRYGLNIYGYGSSMTAEGNCDLYPVGGTRPTASNYNDSLIDLQTVDSDKMLYRITLIKHPGLYLTPVGQYNNANVRWVKSSKENAHIWKLCTSETSSSDGGSGNYVWPTKSNRITTGYSADHPGIDIGALNKGVEGDPIYAFCSGKVKRVFHWNADQGTSGNASMGNCVFIQSTNPKPNIGGSYLRTIYMHMQTTPIVSVDQYVVKGQIIGYMGNTGYSTGPHLHFAMQANNTDMNPETGTSQFVHRDWVNPMEYF